MHSTYDKTVQDVKFCEGWPLVGSPLAVFMINLHKGDCKYIYLGKEITYLSFDMGYGHCATLGAF